MIGNMRVQLVGDSHQDTGSHKTAAWSTPFLTAHDTVATPLSVLSFRFRPGSVAGSTLVLTAKLCVAPPL